MNKDGDAQEIVFLKRRLPYLWIFFQSKAKNERPIREINETLNKKLRLTEDKLKLVADVLKDDFSELD